MLGRGVVGDGIVGVELQGDALEHVHDGVRVGAVRERCEEALGELAHRSDAGLEVVELGRRGQRSGEQEVRDLLVAEAALGLCRVHEVIDLVAAQGEVAPIGRDHAVNLVVAVDARDGGEADEHAGTIGVAQAALDVQAVEEVARHLIHRRVALVELVGDGRTTHALGGHEMRVFSPGEGCGGVRVDVTCLGVAVLGHVLPFSYVRASAPNRRPPSYARASALHGESAIVSRVFNRTVQGQQTPEPS